MTEITPPPGWRPLAEDTRPRAFDLNLAVPVDHRPWGATARSAADGLWRAEHGPHGPALLHARQTRDRLSLTCWAPVDTTLPAEAAMDLARGWVGLHDDLGDFRELAARHQVLRELDRGLGPLPLSRTPSVQEAVGRAVIGQLVQFREAERSTAQLLELAGTPVAGLRAWPSPERLRAQPDWDLRRRCGLSLRTARALRAAAVEHEPLRVTAARQDWGRLDARLRALPGVGQWTSGTARLALGDPDAVPFGDYHLPELVGHALDPGGVPTGGWDDAHLADLLEPFLPHRGRVVRLLMLAAVHRRGPRPPRRAPHAAFSAHRYW